MKLTKTQTRILQIMKDHDESLVFSKGGGWWIGTDKTNGRLAFSLLRGCLISDDGYASSKMESYRINETGIKALETGTYKSVTEILNEDKTFNQR